MTWDHHEPPTDPVALHVLCMSGWALVTDNAGKPRPPNAEQAAGCSKIIKLGVQTRGV